MSAQGQPRPDPAIVRRETILRGRKFDFERLVLRTAEGEELTREVVRHPGAVVVLAIHDDGRVVLVRNLRHAIGARLLELCAGTLEPGEDPAACAHRELIEETGFDAATIQPLGRFYTTPGLTNELMHAFVARGLRPVGQRPEADEWLEVVQIQSQELLAMLDRGELSDAKTMLALLLGVRAGVLPG